MSASTLDVGKKLVELCQKGKGKEAVDELYAQDIVSVEAMATPEFPAKVEGFEAVKHKTEWWEKNHETHGIVAEGPWPHGDRFIVHFTFDVTAKTGPMAGKRMKLDEAGEYTVKDGKIVREEFFYAM
jgi:ketosteroid isomerase-like protein